jgi:hypothetical protein
MVIGSLCVTAHGANQFTSGKLGMNTPPDVESTVAVVVTWPDVPAPLYDVSAKTEAPLQKNATVLDADIDDIASGCSDSDSWYER